MAQRHLGLASAVVIVLTSGAVMAQQPQPGAQRGCVDLAAAPGQPGQPSQGPAKEPATAPDHGGQSAQGSGTSPGSAGSTGWTGGTGGSYVGTVPSGPHPASPQAQPEVATGLDPMKSISKRQAC